MKHFTFRDHSPSYKLRKWSTSLRAKLSRATQSSFGLIIVIVVLLNVKLYQANDGIMMKTIFFVPCLYCEG